MAFRVLAITKLFPNAADPLSAPFNRQQFVALAAHCNVQVLATIPWFPGARLLAKWSSAGNLATVPACETIDGLSVRHPRTLFVPRCLKSTWGPLYVASLAPIIRRYRGHVDVVLGAWAYPDGWAAVVLAELLGVPCVVKVHGSDINLIGKQRGPRRMLAWALPRADGIVAVSRPLADEVAALGVAPERISVVMNGVDNDLFRVRDRVEARRALGLDLDAPIALYVGNLKPEKGPMDLAAAWGIVTAARPDARLVVVGDGVLHAEFAAAVAPYNASVMRVGAQPLAKIPSYLAACNLLVLPSRAEGTPNVVLEAFASGRRVVGTRVGGVPDLISVPALGALSPAQNPAALAHTMIAALEVSYDPVEIAVLGSRGGWAASAAALHGVLASVLR